MKFTGTVKKGKLELHDKNSFNEFISQSEGDVWIIVKPMPKTRSPQQNNYYWIVIKDLAKEIGYTPNEMHEVVKNKFEIESTKNLEQDEFSDFLDRLIRYFAQQGFPVEDPRRPSTIQ